MVRVDVSSTATADGCAAESSAEEGGRVFACCGGGERAVGVLTDEGGRGCGEVVGEPGSSAGGWLGRRGGFGGSGMEGAIGFALPLCSVVCSGHDELGAGM